jgi:hypothetical protein
MNTHQIVPLVFIIIFSAFILWSITRNRRWERYQQEAAGRAKLMIEKAAGNTERFEKAMVASQEQIRLLTELLEEIKGLRADLRENRTPPA